MWHLVGVDGHLSGEVEDRADGDVVVTKEVAQSGDREGSDAVLAVHDSGTGAQGLLADPDVEHGTGS
jgi:hypothetical protein